MCSENKLQEEVLFSRKAWEGSRVRQRENNVGTYNDKPGQ